MLDRWKRLRSREVLGLVIFRLLSKLTWRIDCMQGQQIVNYPEIQIYSSWNIDLRVTGNLSSWAYNTFAQQIIQTLELFLESILVFILLILILILILSWDMCYVLFKQVCSRYEYLSSLVKPLSFCSPFSAIWFVSISSSYNVSVKERNNAWRCRYPVVSYAQTSDGSP